MAAGEAYAYSAHHRIWREIQANEEQAMSSCCCSEKGMLPLFEWSSLCKIQLYVSQLELFHCLEFICSVLYIITKYIGFFKISIEIGWSDMQKNITADNFVLMPSKILWGFLCTHVCIDGCWRGGPFDEGGWCFRYETNDVLLFLDEILKFYFFF